MTAESKLIRLALGATVVLDQITVLGIEYQQKNITADRFSQRTCEILAAYQRQCKDLEKDLDNPKEPST